MAKTISSVGIEFDQKSIRMARVLTKPSQKSPTYMIEDLQEIRGDFAEESLLIEGLKRARSKLELSSHDQAVSCVCGKQVYASQTTFRNMPDKEMLEALRLEIRKNLPFDSTTAALDYQIIQDKSDTTTEERAVLVTAVAGSLIKSHLNTLEKSGIRPAMVDALPTAVANAFWEGRNDPVNLSPNVVLHFAPDVCTLVIDGNGVPYYTRSIHFSADALFEHTPEVTITEAERQRRLLTLGDELRRSLSFYEKTYGVSSFTSMYLMGDYLSSPELLNVLHGRVGLPIEQSGLLDRIGRPLDETPPGKFDIAITLAMRGGAEKN